MTAMVWAGENYVYRNRDPKWYIDLTVWHEANDFMTILDTFSVTELTDEVFECIRVEKDPAQGTIKIQGASL